ncbi:MAG: alpha/beta hydrolase [Chloroflexia bacterium]|nr:alpha/beta hydrolase [Chloroflexia bacterium]
MLDWHDFTATLGAGHTVAGTVKRLAGLYSPRLDNHRDLLVYLPPAYSSGDERYPVLYMHDGQNLFDRASSFAGEWRVDETLQALSQEGLQAIVVGVPNMGERRVPEYSPFPDPKRGGGDGEAYLSFLVETVKARIDRDFRTLAGAAHTGVMGSSLGGLISLYAFFRHPEVFGLAGVISPALFFAREALFAYVAGADFVPGRIYVDVGTREGYNMVRWPWGKKRFSQQYLRDVREMVELLRGKGYRLGEDLLYVEEEGAVHHESAWAARLPGALRFLLRK